MMNTPVTITAMAGIITGITITIMAIHSQPVRSHGDAWAGRRC
jgi:hypothetical protein